ncbi:MAG: methyltransferase domain-containing protein [Anaerolineae bacterium]|jgi:SAM-dependent methyltransferase
MLNAATKDREIKICCATFYQSDVVCMLFGDVFHPGGLDLTRHLGEALKLGPGDHVLDVACGRGASAVHLAEGLGCHVTGLDYGPENVAAAQAHAADKGVAHLTGFRQGDAEGLPFDDGTFDAVVSECSFCTFPNKATAAAEMVRVLNRGGRLGLTDMTVNGPLPDDVQGLLAWVACVAGAGTPEDYVATLREAGLGNFVIEDQRGALLDMVNDVRRKLMGVELAAGLGKLDGSTEASTELCRSLAKVLGELDLGEGKRLARRAIELIENGVVGYTLIAARKE